MSLLQISCSWSQLVQRYGSGDVFQNLGTDAAYCSQRNAKCLAAATVDNLDPGSGQFGSSSCPRCACMAGWRYDNDSCVEGERK